MAGMTWAVTLAGRTFELRLSHDGAGEGWDLEVDGGGEQVEVSLEQVYGEEFLLHFGGRRVPVLLRRMGGGYRVVVDGHAWAAEVEEARLHHFREEVAGLAGHGGPLEVSAPMPGLVVLVEVEEGQEVETGTGLVVIESMKMENEIRAPVGGVVEAVHVGRGEAVDKGQPLARLVPPADGA